ncbi:hypothetical protein [Litorimonas sp.]|uniref:hypothetical protein n=1 Tax=Litorimonas sp. TaxID=1892381 RepID=UPI003A861860
MVRLEGNSLNTRAEFNRTAEHFESYDFDELVRVFEDWESILQDCDLEWESFEL